MLADVICYCKMAESRKEVKTSNICNAKLQLLAEDLLIKGMGIHLKILIMFPIFFISFDLIIYVPSTIFQLNRDGSSWVEPVLS